MQRRRESTTYYNFRGRKLLWRIEWCFPEVDAEAAAAAKPQQQQEQPQPHQLHRWQPHLRRAVHHQQQQQNQQQQAPNGSSAGGSKGLLTLINARADEDKPLRPLLEAHLAYAPGTGAGARRLALRTYAEAVAEHGGDVGVLPVLMRQDGRPVSV